MYSNTGKEEVIIRLVGKLTLEFPDIDQLKVRQIAEETLYKYDITPQETGLAVSDVEDKVQIYLATKRYEGLSEKTLKNYNYSLIKFASHLRKPLAAVETMDLRMFLAVRCQNLRPNSSNGEMNRIKSFFSWLASEGYIPRDPAAALKQIKEPKRVREPLSEEEIEIVRQACITEREKSIVEFAYSTGCRLSEIIGVNKADINWHERTLKVIGKGNKEREVCFTPKAKILLKKYLNTRNDDNPALFIAERAPYGRLGGRSVERLLDKIAARTEIEKPIYPHIFRHSFATHLLGKRIPLHIVQALLGHESSATTQIYAKTSRDNMIHAYKMIS